MTTETFRTQHRGGRGVRGMATNGEDSVNLMVHTRTHTDILFFSTLGKVYRLRGYMVPEESRTSKGLPIQNLLNLEKGEKIVTILPLDDYNPEHYLFFATKQGIVKRTKLGEFESIRRNGKIAIVLREDDALLDVKRTDGTALIGLASSKGKMVKFPEEDVRPIGRTATGVKGMDLDSGAQVIGLTSSLEGDNILVITLYGYGKMSPLEDYRQSHRGTKGVITLNVTNKNGRIVAMRAVKGDEDLMMITNGGTVIRMPLSQIKIIGRNTQGVRVIRLDDEKQRVSSITIIPHDDIVEEDEAAPAEEAQPVEEPKAE
jgi:DNA gyrase subunit A